MPWILLPLLPLFTCYLAIADQLRAWPAYLLIPVAAWLGRRYGARGAITVAVGAAAALLPTFRLGPFEFGGTPDLYDRGREELSSPLPPNRTGGFPAYGSPVAGFLIGDVSLACGPRVG